MRTPKIPPFLEVCQQPDHLGGCFWCQNDRLITYWDGLFLISDMSDVQYVQYWTKYVQYWTNTAISQKTDSGQGGFYCKNYCLITYWGRHFNFRNVTHQLMSNIGQILIGQILDKCSILSIISATRPSRMLFLVSKWPSNYILGWVVFNFRHVRCPICPILDKICPILDKYSYISENRLWTGWVLL